jgi:hypothetical protein
VNKPDKQIEAKFNAAGLYFFDKESFYDRKDFQKIGCVVEIGALPDAQFIELDFMLTFKGRRGVVMSFTDWKVEDRGDQKILSFIAWQKIPNGTFPGVRDVSGVEAPLYLSFVDLCWLAGNMEVELDLAPSVFTKVRDGDVRQADLGWHLPSRFVDPLIDGLGRLNDYVLSGTLEDAILYGPITLNDKE